MLQRHKHIGAAQERTQMCSNIIEIERAVARLDVLAHKIGMEIAIGLPDQHHTPHRKAVAQLRGLSHTFSETLSDTLCAGRGEIPADDDGAIGTFQQVFNPQRRFILNHFQQCLREICATGKLPDQTRRELLGFIATDLSDTLQAISSAVRSAGKTAMTVQGSLALTDDLTGIPNRRAFSELGARLGDPENDPTYTCVMHIDIDRLKTINDMNGHAAGDAAIRHAAICIRDSTSDAEFCARIGGDEFIVVIFDEHGHTDLSQRAAGLIAKISQDFYVDGKPLNVGASIGISSGWVSQGHPLDALLKDSDMALYASKNSGRGIYAHYDPTMRTRRDEIDALAGEISTGISRGEFVPFFQPQVEGRSGKLVGVEALVRWNHPTRGLLTPYYFLDGAAEAGMLVRLDQQIMRDVFAAARRWQDNGHNVPKVSINITSERLNSKDIVSELLNACQVAGIAPDLIGLEILESAMIEDKSRLMIENAAKLSSAGFQLELDDFGTGHASVSNLRFFKVDRIKIDKSFIKDIHQHNDLSMITSSVIGLAHSLRIDALGEGVEKPEERLILNALGCDHIQGYGVSHPLPENDLIAWVKRTQTPRKPLDFMAPKT